MTKDFCRPNETVSKTNMRLHTVRLNKRMVLWLMLFSVSPVFDSWEKPYGRRVFAFQEAQTSEMTVEMPDFETLHPSKKRPAALIKIQLPITVASASQVKFTLQQLAESAPLVVRPTDRTVAVLEFDTASGRTGRGSELEACQLLARYLVSADMSRLDTVAYIPAAQGAQDKVTTLSGHALLVLIAANQIAMEENTEIGSAGIDEIAIDNLVREVYRGIASQRLTLPVPMVMAMLEKNAELYRVQTDAGQLFVDGDELAELEKNNRALETVTLSKAGEFAHLGSQDLDAFGLIRRPVKSRGELAASLKLLPHALEHSSRFAGKWQPIQINLPSYIDDRTANWVMRTLGSRLSRNNPPNLVILNLEDNGGDVDACLKLARYLVDLDSAVVQTVSLVRGQVRGPAALLALSTDQLLMGSEAILGGELDETDRSQLTPEVLDDLLPAVKSLARDHQRDWSLMMSTLDPQLNVDRYRHNRTGQLRLLSPAELEELNDKEVWDQIGAVDTARGLTAATGEQLLIVRTIANDPAELRAFYQLEQELPILETTTMDRSIERFAGFLSRADVASLLLFMAVFLLSTEMSSPGLGFPGFMATVCFMLFFWSQYLEGNAGWLEIMLFVAGVAFILIEIFATPGMGMFGIGGIAMVISSMILASQNFTFSASDLEKLPRSLLPVLGAVLGFFAALFALRNVLPHSPVFKKMILHPRADSSEAALELGTDPEAIVDWSYLQGRTGDAVTRLIPSGKARIDGRVYDVITLGRMIEKGQPIQVVEAVGNRVVVEPKSS
jgi:membrane-bound serine protease (ClpP class)